MQVYDVFGVVYAALDVPFSKFNGQKTGTRVGALLLSED